MIALISKNAVQTFVDVRKVPVFRKPHFRHKQLIDYMIIKAIDYVDFTSDEIRNEIPKALVSVLASQPHPLFGQKL
jgi:hypothetical protein